MRAVVLNEYGPPEVLKIVEVEKPVPKTRKVLIRIHATTVTAAYVRIRACRVPAGFRLLMRLIFGVLRPRRKILGFELAGEISAVGKEVKSFEVGEI